jgi:hypothetical protein
MEDHDLRRPAKRRLAGQELEKRRAHAILVAGGIGLACAGRGQLRCHVSRCAHDGALFRELLTPRTLESRQPKVHQMRLALVVKHDVGRLDITVDDPLGMRALKRVGKIGHDRNGGACVDFSLVDRVRQALAADELAGDVVVAAIRAGLEHGDDMRVAQLGGCLGFAEEPLGRGRICQQAGLRDLERHFALQHRVDRAVDRAERAGAQALLDDKPPDPLGQRDSPSQ